jgi:hypothetical protein
MNRPTRVIRAKTISFLSIAVLVLSSIGLAKYSGGSGEPNNPYQISSVADWQELMATPTDWGGHFILTSDIDLNGVFITPIAPDTSTIYGFQGTPFTGVFDGNDCVIRNADVNVPGSDYVGLFGCLATNGQIKNLAVEDASIFGQRWVGRLVGINGGTISNCYSTGNVTGTAENVGGLIGCNYGEITDCYSTGSVTGTGSYVGGLVGWNIEHGTITNCYSTGSVSGTGAYVGGLVGENYEGSIRNCYSTGSVSGDSLVGGLVGINGGTISNCYSTTSVNGTGSCVGGLVGINGGTISNCYSTGPVNGTYYVGGLVGDNDSTGVTGGWIHNCYSTGSVDGLADVGGLVGRTTSVTISRSFWDVNTSGWTNSAGGTGKTTAQMQDINTFLEAGWDFVGETPNGTCNFWLMPESGGYPVLSTFNGYIPAEPPGSGSEADPYIITDSNELGTVWYRPSACYVMANDIDLAGISWSGSVVPFFSGVFDGNGYIVRNADVNMPGSDYVGLFGYVGAGGQIRNLGLEDVSIGGSRCVGGLVGISSGTISNCYSTGSVSGTDDSVGGLVGGNGGTISNCYSTGSVAGNGRVGGLVGGNSYYATIIDCYSTGSVTGTGDYVGGLVGWNGGTITNCYSTGSVTGTGSYSSVGGLVGGNNGTIIGCYSTGSLSGTDYVGGLVGSNVWGKISNSFWDVNTSGEPNSAGGIGKTTAEMMTLLTFTSAGWDFTNETANGTNDYWRMCVNGVEYPLLSWQFALKGDFTCPDGVDILDLAFLVDKWLAECNETNNFCNRADINYDEIVNFPDFAILALHWLEEK